jgi:hypothetical protein
MTALPPTKQSQAASDKNKFTFVLFSDTINTSEDETFHFRTIFNLLLMDIMASN